MASLQRELVAAGRDVFLSKLTSLAGGWKAGAWPRCRPREEISRRMKWCSAAACGRRKRRALCVCGFRCRRAKATRSRCPRPRQLPRHCAILSEARVAVTPMAGALRFGGTMELAGLDETINRRPRARHRARGAALFPGFPLEDFAGIEPWSGLRPCSPDGLPYLGRCGAFANLSDRDWARDDGPEPRPDHRQAHGRDPRRRAPDDRSHAAFARPFSPR